LGRAGPRRLPRADKQVIGKKLIVWPPGMAILMGGGFFYVILFLIFYWRDSYWLVLMVYVMERFGLVFSTFLVSNTNPFFDGWIEEVRIAVPRFFSFQKMHILLILILEVLLVGACVPATPIESPTEAVKIRPQGNGNYTSTPEETLSGTKELAAPSVAPMDPEHEVAATLFSTPLTPAMTQEAPVMEETTTPTLGDQLPDNIYVVQAKEDLASRLDVGKDQIELVEFKAVVWPDGSFGCPQPGIAYTQVQQEGYLIQLRFESKLFDYHGGGNTPPFLCEETTGN